VLTILTGVVYPVLVTGIAQAVFPRQANGSLIAVDGKAIGSSLIGQPFDDPKYFWSRPSATSPFPDNAGSSSGSNLSPTNPALITHAPPSTSEDHDDPRPDALSVSRGADLGRSGLGPCPEIGGGSPGPERDPGGTPQDVPRGADPVRLRREQPRVHSRHGGA